MRLLIAVVTGYLIFAISSVLLFQLTQQDPRVTPGTVFAVTSVVWGLLFAALGGFMAARIAQRAGLLPSALLAGVIATGALASLVMESHQGSMGSELSALLLMAPSAVAGGLADRLIGRRRQS
jgi:hypothetical protein